MPKDVIPNEWELRSGRRHKRQDMEKAMGRNIERALVELITNSDDSYRDLEKENKQVSCKIRIEIERRKKRQPSIVIVRDRARGMNRCEMYYKLGGLGERTSGHEKGKARRGLHGRGAKDVAAFGTVHFESIKNGEYNHLIIPPSLKCRFTENRAKKVTKEIRRKLGIPKGKNGTVVTIEVDSRFKVPLHETLVKDFSRYYSLRDIFSNPSREVKILDLNKNREDRLLYRYPQGEVVFDSYITILDYLEAKIHIIIRKHNKSFEQNYYSPYREGILAKSVAAIHNCTYFGLETESFAWRFSGEMLCEFIDKLVREYDNREEENPDNPNHPENNPMRLLDPFREGLIPEHPFTVALYKKCKEILQEKIRELKDAEEPPKRDVTDEGLDKKLKSLSKEISKVFEKKVKELEEEIQPGGGYRDPIEKLIEKLSNGLHFIPGEEIQIIENLPKSFFVVVKHYEALDASLPVELISINPDKVKLRTSPVFLKKISEDGKIGKTTFTLESSKVGAEAYIEAYYGNYKNSVLVKVVEPPPPFELPEGLSFDKLLYHVKINKEKTLTLWLKTKTELDNSIIAEVSSDHPEVVVKGGGMCELRATNVPRILKGKINVFGRQLQAKGTVTARVRGFECAQTSIIVEEREPKSGVKLKFEPRDEDFGIVRYKWDDKDPNLLLIGAKHPSVGKYLGQPNEQGYPGIDSSLYHTVLAEIIAEALAFKILEIKFKSEGQEGMLDFYSTDSYFHKDFSDFLIIAHKNLVLESIEK